MVFEEFLSRTGAIFCTVNTFFPHDVEAACYTHAQIATNCSTASEAIVFVIVSLSIALCLRVDLLRVPFSKSELHLFSIVLLGDNGSARAPIILEADPDLADMGSVSLVLDSIRYQIVPFRFERGITMAFHLFRGGVEHGGVIRSPLNLCSCLLTKAGYLTRVELELSEHHLLTLEEVASVRPSKQAWIVETAVFEECAIDLGIRPDLEIGMIRTIVSFGLMVSFLPLIHFDFALQSVAVLGYNAEFAVAKIRVVVGCASYVNELANIVRRRHLAVNRDARFASSSDQFCEGYSLLLVFPDQNLRKWNQE